MTGRGGMPTPPQWVQLAWWLWLASVVVGLVRTVVQLSDRRMLIDRLRQVQPELSQSEVDAAANTGIMFALLLGLLIAGAFVLLANRMAQGRNWARIVILVFAAFNVVSTVFTLFGLAVLGSTVTVQDTTVQVDAWNIVFSLVIGALDAAVLVLLLRPDVNTFFREARRRFHEQKAGRTGGHG
ncbi:hypothetical protein DFQ14_101236 [Halopolyspora algeriensis]|uniref:Uncharacterized protein n=2 Tax=Halopolyspora algeriensis TaxID=1500506 RepID=A0A368VXG7_9ACTN|nr:hypothetical protein DFQ14_101236 [Halopolyspora algeriensis]TQM47987.1 hypothetical protein FHU43_2939 [Halopolyspora algeriensis]